MVSMITGHRNHFAEFARHNNVLEPMLPPPQCAVLTSMGSTVGDLELATIRGHLSGRFKLRLRDVVLTTRNLAWMTRVLGSRH